MFRQQQQQQQQQRQRQRILLRQPVWHSRLLLLLFLLLLVVNVPQLLVSSSKTEIELARQEVLENRQRRAKQLEVMLADAQGRLDEHASHLRVLDSEEKASLERKVELYSRKLEMLNQVPSDFEIDRILARERERDVRVHARRQKQLEQQEQKRSSSTSSSSSSTTASEEESGSSTTREEGDL
ncbi:hypothetical protein ACA910_021174 [Epithemia clementina (nom. ined.)]